jgi:hypothetical protein
MKRFRQIREDSGTDVMSANKLASLIRAGLFEEKKLAILKKTMSKDPNSLTLAERKILFELANTLIDEVHHRESLLSESKASHLSKSDPRFSSSFPTDKEMPYVIILKRKGIRVYSDNQKVGLYYSQALDKYVTIPFGPTIGSVNEELSSRYDYDGDIKYVRKDDPRYVSHSYTSSKGKTRFKKADLYAQKPQNLSDPDYKQLQKAYSSDSELHLSQRLGAKAGAAFARKFLKPTKIEPKTSVPSVKQTDKSDTSSVGTPSVSPWSKTQAAQATKKITTSTPTPSKKITKKQQSVLTDVLKRKRSAVNIAAKAKDPSLSPEQKKSKINTARRYASYGQLDRRKVGLEEQSSRSTATVPNSSPLDVFKGAGQFLLKNKSKFKRLARGAPGAAETLGDVDKALKDTAKAKERERLKQSGATDFTLSPDREELFKQLNRVPGITQDKPQQVTGTEAPAADIPAKPIQADIPVAKVDAPAKAQTIANTKAISSTETLAATKANRNNQLRRPRRRPSLPDIGGGDVEKGRGQPHKFGIEVGINKPQSFDPNVTFNRRMETSYLKSLTKENVDDNRKAERTLPKTFSYKFRGKKIANTSTSPASSNTPTTYQRRLQQKELQYYNQPISESIKKIAEGDQDSCIIFVGENKVTINRNIAKKFNTLHESLNSKNKVVLEKMLNEGNIDSFKKVIEFAVR